jgi:hypothetical protein
MSVVLERNDNPERRGYEDITEKYNRARDLVLNNGYDALLTVEADMIVPPGALKRLSSLETDVAYGLYCSRRPRHSWLVFLELSERQGTAITKKPDLARKYWGRAIESCGAGLGCTLIKRHVLEEIDFRLQSGGPASDWWFALDCIKAGFRQVSDLSTVCGHIDKDMVIWPDPGDDKLYKIERL